jgi:hypothetical protein
MDIADLMKEFRLKAHDECDPPMQVDLLPVIYAIGVLNQS